MKTIKCKFCDKEAKEKMLNVDYQYQRQKQEAEARGQANIFDFIEVN